LEQQSEIARIIAQPVVVAGGSLRQNTPGLTAELEVRDSDGTQRLLPLPEITGVTAYYETTLVFEQEGAYTLT
jgi:hypothetical protein